MGALTPRPYAPYWSKQIRGFAPNSVTYGAFNGGAFLQATYALFDLPPGGIIHGIYIKHSQSFSGGAIASYTLSVGIAGQYAKYAPAFNVYQAPAANALSVSMTGIMESQTVTTNVLVLATSTGANLNMATQGIADIWALLSNIGA